MVSGTGWTAPTQASGGSRCLVERTMAARAGGALGSDCVAGMRPLYVTAAAR